MMKTEGFRVLTKKVNRILMVGFVFMFLGCSNAAHTDFVHDNEEVLKKEQIAELTNLYKAHFDKTGNEILLVTSPDFGQYESAKDFAVYYGDMHNVGGSTEKGLVMAVSQSQKRIFILTGKALVTALPDDKVQEVIHKVMAPAFQNEDYFEGVRRGSNRLIRILEGRELKLIH